MHPAKWGSNGGACTRRCCVGENCVAHGGEKLLRGAKLRARRVKRLNWVGAHPGELGMHLQ